MITKTNSSLKVERRPNYGAPGPEKKLIFVLGDSRTGTSSLHTFLRTLGYSSIHYFYKESDVTEPAHVEYEENWKKLRSFISHSGFQAYSDYPLRTFFRELFAEFPDAYFVLTVRRDLKTWQESMVSFFEKFKIDLDIAELSKFYLRVNEEIKTLACSHNSRFCEICIDDAAVDTGTKLANFLGHGGRFTMGHENSTVSVDLERWSGRVSLFNSSTSDPLAYVKGAIGDSKAVLSESSWIFLLNDTSSFMDYYFGYQSWLPETVNRAVTVLSERAATLHKNGIAYFHYAVPEKACVYPEFLPKLLKSIPPSSDRPAQLIASKGLPYFDYPLDWIVDAKSWGHLYFHGDSHMNWLGAFNLYLRIAERFNAEINLGSVKGQNLPLIPLTSMVPSLAAYQGDLFVQLDESYRQHFHGAWEFISPQAAGEYLVKLELAAGHKKSFRCEPGEDYKRVIQDRETIRFKNPNSSLPRAVIFRDSTSDFILDLLAEHFSECLFVWHKGLVYEDVIDRERPDVVLHIMAERFLVQYSSSPAFSRLWPSNT